jgi:hypothetical protein
LLVTNYFEDTSNINQSEINKNNEQEIIKLNQLISERDHIISGLNKNINSLHE